MAGRSKELANLASYTTTVNANIGVGTNNPTEKMDVNGNVKANNVVINETPVSPNHAATVELAAAMAIALG